LSQGLARSSVLTIGALTLRLFTQAAALTLTARLLGPSWYGAIAAAASLATLLGIIPNLGAGLTVIARARRKTEVAADVWRYAWPQHLVISPLIAVIYIIAATKLTHGRLDVGVLVLIAMSEVMITPVSLQLSATLQAIDRVPLSQFIQWIALTIRVIGLGTCFLLPFAPPTAYAASQLAAATAGLVIAMRITSKHVPLNWRPRAPRRDELRDGAAYSATSIIAANSLEIDKIVAVRVVSAHDAGLYATMSRIVSAGTLPIIGLMMSAQPRLFHQGAERLPGTGRLVLRIALACLLLGAVAAAGLHICAPLLPWLFGEQFDQMTSILPVMSLVIPAMSLRLGGTNVMLTLGRPEGRIVFDLCGGALLIGSMWWAGETFGIRGLAGAVLTSEIVLAAAAWTIVALEIRKGFGSSGSRPKPP
jgi:O-antigen/teichoic acid export membrane protein